MENATAFRTPTHVALQAVTRDAQRGQDTEGGRLAAGEQHLVAALALRFDLPLVL